MKIVLWDDKHDSREIEILGRIAPSKGDFIDAFFQVMQIERIAWSLYENADPVLNIVVNGVFENDQKIL